MMTRQSWLDDALESVIQGSAPMIPCVTTISVCAAYLVPASHLGAGFFWPPFDDNFSQKSIALGADGF